MGVTDSSKRRQAERRLLWQELEEACAADAATGLGGRSLDQVVRFAALYRMASRDLSAARSEQADPATIQYLNRLVALAHSRLYRPQREPGGGLGAFVLVGFPAAMRRHLAVVLRTFALFWLVVLASGAAVLANPELAESLFYEGIVEHERYRLEREQGEYKGNFTFSPSTSPLASAQIIVNNVRVAIVFFAGGATLGILTLYGLVFNALMVGCLCGLTLVYGHGFDFMSLIATHGVLELTALVIAAAGGMLLGGALLSGGATPRRHRLRQIAPDACRLLGGAVLMLLVSGLIEGFVTPHFDAAVRITVALGSGLAFLVYLWRCGWRGDAPAVPLAAAPASPS